MELTLKNYRCVFPNEVYSTTSLVQTGDNGDALPVEEILMFRRFTEPSENQVIEHIINTASANEGVGTILLLDGSKGVSSDEKSNLERAIIQLPSKIKIDLLSRDPQCLEYMRSHTPARVILSPENPDKFLRVRFGIVPSSLVSRYNQEGKIKDSGWYEAAFENDKLSEIGLGEKWNMRIRLEEDGNLPARDEMNILLKHGTHGSRTLDINKTRYDSEHIGRVVGLIYDSLSKPDYISKIKDISEEILDQASLIPIVELHRLVHQHVQAAEETKRKG